MESPEALSPLLRASKRGWALRWVRDWVRTYVHSCLYYS